MSSGRDECASSPAFFASKAYTIIPAATPSPTSSPTPSPTPHPTASPTPGPTAPAASAVGDPHLTTIRGERFDLMMPRKRVIVKVPRGRARRAFLRVDAEAQRFGDQRADLYCQELNLTGTWVGKKNAHGFHYHASKGTPGKRAQWVRCGRAQIKVAHGHAQQGAKYLNFYIKGLAQTGFDVGGLLGGDDHSKASAVPEQRGRRVNL